MEAGRQLDELLLGAVLDASEHDPLLRERGDELTVPETSLALAELLDPLADLGQHRPGGAAVVGANVQSRGGLVEQPGHADGEELVQVRGEEGAVLDPFEQRQAGVKGLLEDPQAPVQARELAVQEPVGGLGPACGGHYR